MHSRLLRDAPLLHRLLHRLTSTGMRGTSLLWRAAAAVAPLPSRARWSPDGRLSVDLGPIEFAQRGLYEGRYEAPERAIVEQLVGVGDTCVDVGASFGIYSVLLASMVGPQGRVIACEPAPPALRRLEATSRSAPCIEVHDTALGARAHEATLVVTAGDAMHSSIRRDVPPVGSPHDVAVVALTDLVAKDSRIAFVKVDVEGYESEVLEGMWPLLVGGQVDAMMIEAEPTYGDLAWVERLGRLKGYGLFALSLELRRLRWRARLAPVGREEPIARTLFLVRCEHPALARLAVQAAARHCRPCLPLRGPVRGGAEAASLETPCGQDHRLRHAA